MELNQKEKIEEIAKVYANPVEFLRYVRIQEPGELGLPYQIWSHIPKLLWALEEWKLMVIVKAKQVSLSWTLAGVKALRKIYTTPGANVLMISSGDREAQRLLEKVKVVWHNLPEWMKCIDLEKEPLITEPNSMSQFGIKQMGSCITALPSTEKSGIGETADLVIHDEADFHDYFKTNLGHTMATVADNPRRQLVVVSTVDKAKPDSDFKQLYKGAIGSGYSEAGTNNFHALFLPYNVRPDRDEAWYAEQKRTLPTWELEANYPRTIEEALSPMATTSCFNKEVLTELWDEVLKPEVREGFIHILHPKQVGVQYCAGVDVGEGVGLDYSACSIVGKQGLSAEVVAVIYSNTIGTDSFAFEVDRLCREYGVRQIVVDNIGIGRAVIDKLGQLGTPGLYKMNETKYGWALTKPNKRELVVKLVEKVNNKSLITRFAPQVKEMMEYQWVNGYPEPTGKTHGDLVISLELAVAVLDKLGTAQKASYYAGGVQIW